MLVVSNRLLRARLGHTICHYQGWIQKEKTVHLYNTIQDVVNRVTLSQPKGGKDPPKKEPTTTKPNYNERAHINGIKGNTRASGSGD